MEHDSCLAGTARTLASAALVLTVITGCVHDGAIVTAYDAPERNDRNVAILYTPKDAGSPSAWLVAIDGRSIGTDLKGYPRATKALPGKVRLKVKCYLRGLPDSFLLVDAVLEAGHYYELGCAKWSASYTDRGTNYTSVKHRLPDSLQDKLGR